MQHSYSPSLPAGSSSPNPKANLKDLSIPNNYHGIAILSNMSKVLEKLILLKINHQHPPLTLNPLQSGFQQHMSCIHTAFVLQEAIQSLREHAYLDVRKAFDTVWHEGLLVKMYKKGVTGHIWSMVYLSGMVTGPIHSPSCKVSARVVSFLPSFTAFLWMNC